MNLRKKKHLITLICLIGICLLIGCTPKKTPSGDIYSSDLATTTTDAATTTQDSAVTETAPITTDTKLSDEALEKITFNIDKLKDPEYVSAYGDEEEPSVWYTAAEELGIIGKPAIPYLIANLQTKDAYEKGLTLYALLLATQQENVQSITNGDYINVNLTFIPEEQVQYEKDARTWWEKYKDQF